MESTIHQLLGFMYLWSPFEQTGFYFNVPFFAKPYVMCIKQFTCCVDDGHNDDGHIDNMLRHNDDNFDTGPGDLNGDIL